MIYSEDAPGLEASLHDNFSSRRVNLVNLRKEFFRVNLSEIAEIVRQNQGEIEFTMKAEAEEYRKTQAMIAKTNGVQKKPAIISRLTHPT